ncbi:MAG TPA: twin-arginine translocase subunit TatB [Gammaproteobacteria bacterium]|nr:twin-arginine translocase subunit TatB [Gammaproteobacteria bacterium]
MFDVGFWEILLIGVVSLLVIGPEKLPSVARNVGRWVGKIQRFVAGVKSDFNAELQSGELRKLLGDQENQIQELRQMVKDAREGFSQEMSDATQMAEKNLEHLRKDIDDVSASAEPIQPSPDTAESKPPTRRPE